jgi:hypothetical protein
MQTRALHLLRVLSLAFRRQRAACDHPGGFGPTGPYPSVVSPREAATFDPLLFVARAFV